MNCTDPKIKQAFDEAAERYKSMVRNDDGSPVNPNYPSAVIWKCIQELGITGPVDVHDAMKMAPVRRSFRALFEAEMELEELDASTENVAYFVAVVKRVRQRVLDAVRLCMSGQYRA
jgi:hypothetical protein